MLPLMPLHHGIHIGSRGADGCHTYQRVKLPLAPAGTPPEAAFRKILADFGILYDRHEIFSKFASFVPILKHTNWAPKQNMYEKDLQNLGGRGAYFRIKIWAGRGQILGIGQQAMGAEHNPKRFLILNFLIPIHSTVVRSIGGGWAPIAELPPHAA